ncbi:MAG TPA: hypothetical protein VFO27_16345 [Bryobacteraceae bacterium]|nr:hypothetical protein [Bryobacteraceae bacterium]
MTGNYTVIARESERELAESVRVAVLAGGEVLGPLILHAPRVLLQVVWFPREEEPQPKHAVDRNGLLAIAGASIGFILVLVFALAVGRIFNGG